MFDAGFWEFFLIAIIALIVVGPDKMPALAKSAGKMVGKLKRFVADAKDNVESEIGTEKLASEIKDSGNILEIVKDTEKNIKQELNQISDNK
jgi:sec-independent protein translocase protein TatB